jgi:hypothetical protein
MLSPFQRKNPNRPVSASAPLTYLTRALEEGRIDELALWMEDGVLEKKMLGDGKTVVLNGLVKSLIRCKDEKDATTVEGWFEALRAKASLTTDDYSLFLRTLAFPGHSLGANRMMDDFLDHGADPLLADWSHEKSVLENAFLFIAEGGWVPPPTHDRAAGRDRFVRLTTPMLDRLPKNPAWLGQDRGRKTLDLLVWKWSAAWASDPVMKSFIHQWIDTLVTMGAQPETALRRLIGSTKPGRHEEQVALANRLLQGPVQEKETAPPSPSASRHRPNPDHSIFRLMRAHAGWATFAPPVQAHGANPWEVGRNLRSSHRHDGSEPQKEQYTFFGNKPLQGELPVDWAEWLPALIEMGASNPPPAEWQRVAFEEWALDALAGPVTTVVVAHPPRPDATTLKTVGEQWRHWSTLGHWAEDGVPNWLPEALSNTHFNLDRRNQASQFLPLLAAGLPVVTALPGGIEALFGKSLALGSKTKWFHELPVEFLFHCLNDPEHHPVMEHLLQSEAGAGLVSHLWPAWLYGQMFFKTRYGESLAPLESFLPEATGFFQHDDILTRIAESGADNPDKGFVVLDEALRFGLRAKDSEHESLWRAFLKPGYLHAVRMDIYHATIPGLLAAGLTVSSPDNGKSAVDFARASQSKPREDLIRYLEELETAEIRRTLDEAIGEAAPSRPASRL